MLKVLGLTCLIGLFVIITGNGEEATTITTYVCGDKCCANYKRNNWGACEECPAGTFGIDCQQLCPLGYFGVLCKSKCKCSEGEKCFQSTGCISTIREKTDTGTGSSRNTAPIVYVIIVFLGLSTLLLGFGCFFRPLIKRFHRFRRTGVSDSSSGQVNQDQQEGADRRIATAPNDDSPESSSFSSFSTGQDNIEFHEKEHYLTAVTKHDPYTTMTKMVAPCGIGTDAVTVSEIRHNLAPVIINGLYRSTTMARQETSRGIGHNNSPLDDKEHYLTPVTKNNPYATISRQETSRGIGQNNSPLDDKEHYLTPLTKNNPYAIMTRQKTSRGIGQKNSPLDDKGHYLTQVTENDPETTKTRQETSRGIGKDNSPLEDKEHYLIPVTKNIPNTTLATQVVSRGTGQNNLILSDEGHYLFVS